MVAPLAGRLWLIRTAHAVPLEVLPETSIFSLMESPTGRRVIMDRDRRDVRAERVGSYIKS